MAKRLMDFSRDTLAEFKNIEKGCRRAALFSVSGGYGQRLAANAYGKGGEAAAHQGAERPPDVIARAA